MAALRRVKVRRSQHILIHNVTSSTCDTRFVCKHDSSALVGKFAVNKVAEKKREVRYTIGNKKLNASTEPLLLVILWQHFQPFPLLLVMTKNHQPDMLLFNQLKWSVGRGVQPTLGFAFRQNNMGCLRSLNMLCEYITELKRVNA